MLGVRVADSRGYFAVRPLLMSVGRLFDHAPPDVTLTAGCQYQCEVRRQCQRNDLRVVSASMSDQSQKDLNECHARSISLGRYKRAPISIPFFTVAHFDTASAGPLAFLLCQYGILPRFRSRLFRFFLPTHTNVFILYTICCNKCRCFVSPNEGRFWQHKNTTN